MDFIKNNISRLVGWIGINYLAFRVRWRVRMLRWRYRIRGWWPTVKASLLAMGLVAVALIYSLYAILAQAFVVSKITIWYLAPFGLPTLPIVSAIGVSVIFSFFLGMNGVKREEKSWASKLGTEAIGPWLLLMFAWLLLFPLNWLGLLPG